MSSHTQHTVSWYSSTSWLEAPQSVAIVRLILAKNSQGRWVTGTSSYIRRNPDGTTSASHQSPFSSGTSTAGKIPVESVCGCTIEVAGFKVHDTLGLSRFGKVYCGISIESGRWRLDLPTPAARKMAIISASSFGTNPAVDK